MNTIELTRRTEGVRSFLDIVIDGKPLANHFAGRLGAHPSEISPLGWSSSSPQHRHATVGKFLGTAQADVQPNYLAVLVCEKCGDIGCGAFIVRLTRDAEYVRWSDWNWTSSGGEIQPLIWPQIPEDFVFDRKQYERELRSSLTSSTA
jgi:hypothetical protein